jgi:hypothetical protein
LKEEVLQSAVHQKVKRPAFGTIEPMYFIFVVFMPFPPATTVTFGSYLSF